MVLMLIMHGFINANGQNKTYNHNNGAYLISIWDSINNDADYIIDPYKIEDWEAKFESEYFSALKNNDKNFAFKLSIPLSFIYHS